jgi:hypothetical protein
LTRRLVAAVVVAGNVASAEAPPRWAYQRQARVLTDCRRYLEGGPAGKARATRFETLTRDQVLAACEGMARELAGDLADPALDIRARTETLRYLGGLGRAARPVVPAIIAAMDDYDHDPSVVVRASSFCRAAEALGATDPKNPAVIRALTDALAREAQSGPKCPRCRCALEALARAGPDAAPIAGPVISTLPDEPGFARQLGQATQAIGLSPRASPSVASRPPLPPPVPPGKKLSIDERIARMRALAVNVDQLGPADRQELVATATAYLKEGYAPLRVAGAEAVGALGRLDLVAPALRDDHYEVRRAALDGLAAAGPRAAAYAVEVVDALDPYLGTAEVAAKALVAIGPGSASELERRAATAPEPLRPLLRATALAVGQGDLAPVRNALARGFKRGPHNEGYVRVDILEKGSGVPYNPAVHRIQVEAWGGVYGPGRERAARIEGVVTAENTTYNPFFLALQGRSRGERFRILMSPETALSPFAHSLKGGGKLPPGAAGEFEIDIRKVCQPQVWQLFEGGGIIGPMRIETGCK